MEFIRQCARLSEAVDFAELNRIYTIGSSSGTPSNLPLTLTATTGLQHKR